MAREKKDGVYINLRIQRQLREQLENYADEHFLTLTTALELILADFFESEKDKSHDLLSKK